MADPTTAPGCTCWWSTDDRLEYNPDCPEHGLGEGSLLEAPPPPAPEDFCEVCGELHEDHLLGYCPRPADRSTP